MLAITRWFNILAIVTMFSSSRKLYITRIRSSSCKMFLHSELDMLCTLSLELNTYCLTSWLHNNKSFLMFSNTVFVVDICSDLIFSWACCVCFSSKISACIVDIVSLRIGHSAAHVHGKKGVFLSLKFVYILERKECSCP